MRGYILGLVCLLGCGGTAVLTENDSDGGTPPVVDTDAGQPQPEVDSGQPEPDADAPDACAPMIATTVYPSQDCQLMPEPCSACTGGRLYRCAARLGPALPGTPPRDGGTASMTSMETANGCEQLTNGGVDGTSDFCCPMAWVGRMSQSAKCTGVYEFPMEAPADPDSLLPLSPLVPVPPGCVIAEQGGGRSLACCKLNP